MCIKCYQWGSYDATLEQLNHDPELVRLQIMPIWVLWYNALILCLKCVRIVIEDSNILYRKNID